MTRLVSVAAMPSTICVRLARGCGNELADGETGQALALNAARRSCDFSSSPWRSDWCRVARGLGPPRKAAIHRSPVCGPLTRGKRLESLSHTSHFPLSPFRGCARPSTERDERSRRFEFACLVGVRSPERTLLFAC